jgi:uncharacterized membrane protein YbhN (UPF0104 family)
MLNKILERSKSKPVWIVSLLFSGVLLALVVSQLDWATFRAVSSRIDRLFVALAVLLLLLEGVITALRIRFFTGMCATVSSALTANAWYSLLLIILPARLGEVAAILIFEHHFGQKFGAAAMSIVSQRLFDLVILSTFFCLCLSSLTGLIDTTPMFLLAGLVGGGGLLVLFNLENCLTLVARTPIAEKPKLRAVYRLILQARMWVRHIMPHHRTGVAVLLTLAKWVCNLGGIALLLFAVKLDLSLVDSFVVAAAYNFLAIAPLQTVGGIGVGEVGLMLLLRAFSVDLPIAAAVSILVRLVLLLAPLLFWLLIMIKNRNCSKAPLVSAASQREAVDR